MIDSHHHLWAYDPTAYPWIPAGSALAQDQLPPSLEVAATAAGVTGTIAVQARQSCEETRWLLELAEATPLIHGVVGWLPLASAAADLERSLVTFASHPKLKGARHVLQDEPDAFFDDPAFNRGLARLPACGLRYDLLIHQRQLPAALRLVDRHPQVCFIIDHLAKPEIHSGRIEADWLAGMAQLAGRPNITGVKFSGLATECRDPEIDEPTLRAYLDEALRLFGGDRLMYGSDWPVCLLRLDRYTEWSDLVHRLIAPLTAGERDAFIGRNARRIYGLADPPTAPSPQPEVP
jgi:L-fuconolactonase